MCGIVGVVALDRNRPRSKKLAKGLRILVYGAERRGRDASGYIFVNENYSLFNKFQTELSRQRAQFLGRKKTVRELWENSDRFGLFLHSRMETHGTGAKPENNHPIVRKNLMLIHNGIITNHNQISQWSKKTKLSDTDSESLLMLVEALSEKYPRLEVSQIFDWAVSLTQGANTFVLFDDQTKEFFLSSSNGSLYFYNSGAVLVFASEKYVLLKSLKAMFCNSEHFPIHQVKPGSRYSIKLSSGLIVEHPKSSHQPISNLKLPGKPERNFASTTTLDNIWSALQTIVDSKIGELGRCKACLLPNNYPGINFDSYQTCNFCNSKLKDEKKNICCCPKSSNGSIGAFLKLCGSKVLVPFSGGRDSSFLLHKLKADLGLDVTAFTYDWGFVTDTARENISRMCGLLEIEHLLISADLRKKRRNVALNVDAWSYQPHPGLIPLFMAGDKEFFRVARKLKEEYSFDSIVFGMNRFEPASFKIATMGIDEVPGSPKSTYGIKINSVAQMLLFHVLQFIQNPKFLNLSLFDTARGFYSYYLQKPDYLNFYDYYPWKLRETEEILEPLYGWKGLSDSMRGWRNGDATAPFYNLLYNLMLGFNENNVFIANLLRDHQINLDSARELLFIQKNIDSQGINDYFERIGLDQNEFFDRLLSSGYFQRFSL